MARTVSVSPQQPGAYRTIQDALEVAGDDVVLSIAPGTYIEAVRLDGRRISLVAAGEAGSVIVDAQTIGLPAVSARGADISLQGLVLRAGDTPAISVGGGRLRLRDCEVSARYGAGLSVGDGATVEVSELKITGGRGVYIYQAGRPTLERCEVSHTGDVGISIAHQSAPTIRTSWIHDTQGVGVTVGRGCKGRIEECVFESTASPAIQIEEGAAPTVIEAPAGAGKGFGKPLDKAIQQDPERVDKLLAEQ